MGRIIAKRIRGMNWMAKVSLILVFAVFLSIYLFAPDEAQADTHYSRVASGTWATAATFSTTACGGAAAAAAPAAGDNVVICTGYPLVTLGAIPANVLNLEIQAGATLAGATFLQTLTGSYTNNGTHSGTGGATLSGVAMTIDGTGSVTNTGTFTISGTKTIAATANLTFAGIVTCSAAVTNNGIVTITNTGAGRLAGASSWTQGANSTLNYQGSTITITTFTPTGAGNTVNYNGAVAQTVSNVNNYQNLTLSGTSAKTLGAAMIAIGGNLTLSGSATATTAANLAISGNLDVGTGTTFATGATFTLGVTGTSSITGTFTLAGTGAKTFTGNVTINSGGVWNETGISTYAIAGNFTNNATTFTASTGVHTFSGATKTLSGSTAIVIPSAAFTGTYTNNGTLTVGTVLSGAGGLTQGTNDVLNIGGTSAITTLTATAIGNTVNYNGVAQTVKLTTYNNLTLSGTGAKTFPTGTTTVNGKLSIENGANANTFTGSVAYGTNATLQYNTTSARTAANEWITPFVATGGVIIANTGAITLNAAKNIGNTASVPLTINSGATLDVSATNYALTVGGNWINNGGTFNPRSGTVTFNGTGSQSISGSNTWYGLSITAAAARTVKFASGATQTISNAAGVLTLTGASATQLLTLAPSGATAWLLNKNAAITPTISNVSVSFSDAGTGGLIDASIVANNNSNAGNNINWKFTATINSCVGCHGYKATFSDGTARNTPDGAFQGSHNKHVVTYSKVCSVCHTIPAGETSVDFKHRNGTIQMTGTINSNTGATYSKAATTPFSFAQTNAAFSGGTCSNTYCHSNGTSLVSGTIPPNTSATWGGTANCLSCHGPAGADDGRPNYVNNSPKRNTHGNGSTYGVTHKATVCPTCHTGVSGTAGAYTVDPATHNNGTYNLQSTLVYSAGTCTTPSCHGSATWGGPAFGCVDCHSSTITRTMAAGTLDNVVGEFTLDWGHKKTGRGAVTNADCIVCHLEGDFTTQKPSAKHKDGNIDLRDPDGAGETAITNMIGGVFTFTKFSAIYTGANRFTDGNTRNTIDNVITQKFCLKCHDSGGATNTFARAGSSPTATASFGGGFTRYDAATAFATANSSKHPVLGPLNKDFATQAMFVAPYNNFTRAGTSGTKTLGVVINCFDCHNTPTTPLATRTVAAHGASATNYLRGTIDVASPTLCLICHTGYTGTVDVGHGGAGSAYQTGAASTRMAASTQDLCINCHAASNADARPTRAENVHGTNTLPTGGATKTLRWLAGGTQGVPIAFIRNTTNLTDHQPLNILGTPYTAQCSMTNCGSRVGSPYTPGGTY